MASARAAITSLADAVDRPGLLGDGLAGLRLAAADQGRIAGPEVQEGPEERGHRSRYGRRSCASKGGLRSLPPPKAPALYPSQSVGSRGRPISCFTRNSAWRISARACGQVGPLLERDLDQLLPGRIERDQFERDQRAAGRMEPYGRVEIQALGQPGRATPDALLGVDDVRAAVFPLGLGSFEVGRSPLAGDRISPDGLDDLEGLRFGEPVRLQEREVADQLQLERRHFQQDVVLGGPGVEAGRDPRAAGRPAARTRRRSRGRGYSRSGSCKVSAATVKAPPPR